MQVADSLGNKPRWDSVKQLLDASSSDLATLSKKVSVSVYEFDSQSRKVAIENGKIGPAIKGATLIGNGPDALTHVSMIGNDMRMDSGVGTCGKEGQSVPVGVGQPTLRVDALTVGGTA
jgi:predicted Zn-dependent protease